MGKKDGGISPDCLTKLFTGREQISDLIAEFDTNKDGVLDLQEFRDMLSSNHSSSSATSANARRGSTNRGYALDAEVVRTPQCFDVRPMWPERVVDACCG